MERLCILETDYFEISKELVVLALKWLRHIQSARDLRANVWFRTGAFGMCSLGQMEGTLSPHLVSLLMLERRGL